MKEMTRPDLYTPAYTPTGEGVAMGLSLSDLKNCRVIKNTIYFRMKIPADLRCWFTTPEILKTTNFTVDELEDAKFALDDMRVDAIKTFHQLRKPLSDEIKQQLADTLCPKKLAKINAEEPASAPDISADVDRSNIKYLSDVIDEHFQIFKLNGSVFKSLSEVQYAGWLMLQIMGDKPVADYTSDDAIAYVDTLLKLPPNISKASEYVGRPIPEILELFDKKREKIAEYVVAIQRLPNYLVHNPELRTMRLSQLLAICAGPERTALAGLPFVDIHQYKIMTLEKLLKLKVPATLAKTTVRHKISWASSVFDMAIRKRYYREVNPFEGLHLKRGKRRGASPKPRYTDKQLQALFDLLTWDSEHPERFWVPLIAAFQGIRQNQICQMYVRDIFIDEALDEPCFQFCVHSDDMSLKTSDQYYSVPIHPYLLQLGFLDYAAYAKRRGWPRLWMQLRYKDGLYSKDFGKWFDRKISPLIKGDTRASFHSLRKNFCNYLKQASQSIPVISALVGHDNDALDISDMFRDTSMTNVWYSEEYAPQVLYPVLLKLDYQLVYDMANVEYEAAKCVALVRGTAPPPEPEPISVPGATLSDIDR